MFKTNGKGNVRTRVWKRMMIYGLTFGLLIACLPFGAAPSAHAADEYDSLRGIWKEMMTGGTAYNTSDPDIAAQISSIDSDAQANWNTMNKSSSRTYLWSDLTFQGSSHITASYTRLRSMALAYATTGSSLQNNAVLLADLKSALDWMYANIYNENKSETGSWWDWEIGAPLKLNDTVVLLYGQLSSTQITNYMNAVGKFKPTANMTGANRIWVCTVDAVRGILIKDSATLAGARDRVSPVFNYVTSRDGFYRDGSFIQHFTQAYTGGYGVALLSDVAKLMYLLNGSTWEITDPDKRNVYQWVYDSFEPLVYKGSMMDMVRGRNISRYYQDDHDAGHTAIQAILRISRFAPSADAARMKSMVKYWIQKDTFHSFMEGPIEMIVLGKALLSDSSVAPRGELTTFRQYANMDRTVHLRPGFGFGISAHSSRISNYEAINGENLKGWYTGEGMTYLYNNDLGQFSDGFWQTVNAYRLPGTTVQKNTTVGMGFTSSNDWVGGSELDGIYGTTGMELLRHSSLTMRKSWFMFDDEVVALGSGISGTNGKVIETIIENRKLKNSGNNVLTVNGTTKSSSLGWSQTMSSVYWAHLSGNVTGSDIGYYFPTPANVNGLREARTGAWSDIDRRAGTPQDPITRNYLTLWFDHGANPTNDTYAYVVLPNKTADQVRDYAITPDIAVLENSTEAQAVRENTLKITGVNFWNDAVKTAGGVTSNKKASVMVKETDTEIEVSVSDPTHANTGSISIELNRDALGTFAADAGITVTQLSPTIKFNVNVSGAHGKTFKASFAKRPVLLYETENLTLAESSGDAHTVFKDDVLSGGKGTKLDANAVGDYVSYNVQLPEPGTYRVLIGTKKYSSRGKAQLTIQGSDKGTPFDYYSANPEFVEIDAGEKQFNTAGTKTFKFTITGKNANSSDYTLAFDYIKLVRIDGNVYKEAEDLPATISSGDSRAPFDDFHLSGGKGDKLTANAAGDYINYSVYVPRAGTYYVFVGAKKHASRGIFQLYVDNAPQGSPQDSYALNDAYTDYYLGQITFSSLGTKSFKFALTGKNANSTGYTLALDYVKLAAKP